MYRGRRLANARRSRGGVSRKAQPQTEARVNAGRNPNGPKVDFAAPLVGNHEVRIRLYAGNSGVSSGTRKNPLGRRHTSLLRVTTRLVRTTSRKG